MFKPRYQYMWSLPYVIVVLSSDFPCHFLGKPWLLNGSSGTRRGSFASWSQWTDLELWSKSKVGQGKLVHLTLTWSNSICSQINSEIWDFYGWFVLLFLLVKDVIWTKQIFKQLKPQSLPRGLLSTCEHVGCSSPGSAGQWMARWRRTAIQVVLRCRRGNPSGNIWHRGTL